MDRLMAVSGIAKFLIKPPPIRVEDLDVDIYDVNEGLATPSINGASYTNTDPDLTIIVGQEQKKFQVHKDLFISKSKFFKAACSNSHFREGVENLVRLPEIDSESMIRLRQWFYETNLPLPTDIILDDGYEITLNLLNAADFLEIPAVITIITKATQNYIWKCNSWKGDPGEAAEDEQKKVDLMCRLYECGGKIDRERLKAYLNNLKEGHRMGLFVNALREVEDCHPDFFNDTMTAVYSTVEDVSRP
ncbi:hypothetical protein TWF730_006124 [Orbilia blumenaviensis]|uniref:BTB domain-containing protein n=1 Tax=Orbilia blumenaviensis TaxID=1796055 RepID=A0AAV9TYM9_9PEZI